MVPIKNLSGVKEQFEILKSLTEIAEMSKIYFGALSQQLKTNPVDYFHTIFQTKFSQLDKTSTEHGMLSKYINNSCRNQFGNYTMNIFKIDKQGQDQMISEYRDLTNQKLLFHGSSIQNYNGIFFEGMQISHSESRGSGLLGDGLYFSDRFDKAISYAQNTVFNQCKKASKIVLICEVALGK